jgi:MFS superfamily sulfate permease-like transporter
MWSGNVSLLLVPALLLALLLLWWWWPSSPRVPPPLLVLLLLLLLLMLFLLLLLLTLEHVGHNRHLQKAHAVASAHADSWHPGTLVSPASPEAHVVLFVFFAVASAQRQTRRR